MDKLKTWGLGAAFAVVAGVAVVAVAAPMMHPNADKGEGKEMTMQGEVIDLHCYMLHPDTGKGMDHAACAKMCIENGLPIGFLANDGTVYLLLGKDHKSIKGQVAKLAGMPVEIMGTMMDHDGIKAIQMSSIKKMGAAKEGMKEGSAAPGSPAKGEQWVCPMGDYVGDHPGKCPKCGMTLEKKKA